MRGHDDKGSAARFFKTFEPDTGAGFRYQAKASRAERNAGLEGMEEKPNPSKDYGFKGVNLTRKDGGENRVLPTANSHPTVKSIALMSYLVRMVTPPGGTVLDPFAGSGSTLVAAVQEGFDCIGIEAEREYAEIARRRIAHCNEDDSHTLF
jgi:site-specific DNA-methyltransferase (adenine-specific)